METQTEWQGSQEDLEGIYAVDLFMPFCAIRYLNRNRFLLGDTTRGENRRLDGYRDNVISRQEKLQQLWCRWKIPPL